VWPHFWAIQLILAVLILMYNTLHELVRVIGKDRAIEIFFGRSVISALHRGQSSKS
jgi:hypothetical protein